MPDTITITATGDTRLVDALTQLIEAGLEFSTAAKVFADRQAQEDPTSAGVIAAARDFHHKDGHVEIDEGAMISYGDDPGAYVMAWVWIDLPGGHDADGTG